jgi:hypothetical protein
LAFVSRDETQSLAAAGLALVKLFDRDRSIQDFISAFEIDVVKTYEIALWIANQPVTGLEVQSPTWRGNL